MAVNAITVPFPLFYEKIGKPLDNGNIYIGVAGLDPESNPVEVFFDSNVSIPASAPLKTLNGFIHRNGSPTGVYIPLDDYSITVRDKNGQLVYTALNSINPSPVSSVKSETYTATSGQTVFSLSNPYVIGNNNLEVYINGAKQDIISSYVETNATTVTFSEGLDENDNVQFLIGNIITTIKFDSLASQNVTHLLSISGAKQTDLRTKLSESVSVKDFGAVGDGVTDDTKAIQDAIDYVAGFVTGGGVVVLPYGVYLHSSSILMNQSIMTLHFDKGARLKASASMNCQITMGDGVNRKERINITSPYLDGNNLSNFGICDLGTRISQITGGYFKNMIEFCILQEPTTADYSEFLWVSKCQGFDGKGFFKHLATAIGRATDTVVEDCVMFRPALFHSHVVSGQRFKFLRNMVGSQTAAYSGGIYITASDLHTLPHSAEHLIKDLYVESNTTLGAGIEAVVIENQNTTRVVSGCVIEDVRVEPINLVTYVRISSPAAGGSRQHQITGIDPKGGFSNSIIIGNSVAYTRINSVNADASLSAYINDSGTNTVINGQLKQAAGKFSATSIGAVGDIIKNTSNNSFWTVDENDVHLQISFGTITATVNINLPSIGSLGYSSFTVAVVGASLGDFVSAAFAYSQLGLIFDSYVSATDTVEVVVFNPTGAAIDRPAADLRLIVTRY